MRGYSAKFRHPVSFRLCSLFLVFIFSFSFIFPLDITQAQILPTFNLPLPGTMVTQTSGYIPTLIKGIEINPQNPFQFNFIVDTGESNLQGEALQEESLRVIKYFLASLTIPENEVWVNLSPYEEDRVIPESFGKTGMGMDLLAEDYLLKQLTASLMYPEKELGKKFWDRVHARAQKEYGISDIPMDSFHKVWIVPKEAEVVQIGNRAFVGTSSLEVMLEEDYLASREALSSSLIAKPDSQEPRAKSQELTQLQTKVMKEIVLPEIEKEVNEGRNFSRLRQIYNATILATWFKIALKESILGKVYVDQNKVAGVDTEDPQAKQKIYDQYVEAFKQGVYDYIKEDEDAVTGEIIPRRYFSGGYSLEAKDGAMLSKKVQDGLTVIDLENGPVTPEQQQKVGSATQPNSGNSQTFNVGVNLKDSDMEGRLERVRQIIREKYPNFPEITSQFLLDRLLSAMTSSEFLVHDITLEAILSALSGDAQTGEGKGGLGFLAGETYGAYENGIGVMPLYDHTKTGIKIDWDHEKGIERVYIKGKDGQEQGLSLEVELNGRKYRTDVYWVNQKGTPVFLLRNAEIFDELYPDPDHGPQRMLQYGLIGKAYVALMNQLGIGPDILRLNEAQLVFVEKAVEQDIRAKGKDSVFAKRRTVTTNHTPERAALPTFDQDRAWLENLLGKDLVDDDMYEDENGAKTFKDGRLAIKASEVLARKSFVITTVSEEHGQVTERHVLPQFAWKTTYIQNGSDPDQWHSAILKALINEKGFENISGKDLFEIGQQQKSKLNEWLVKNNFNQFSDLDRPLFAAIRRLVEYKEQGIFIAMVYWITGDRNLEYDTPWAEQKRQKGLGANLMIGGPISDEKGREWAAKFRQLQEEPELKGKLVFIDKTGTEIMGLATSAADVWLESPRPTREASGTSHQRALLNGKLVIASATGGQLAVVQHYVNSWLVDVFRTGGFTRVFDRVADALDDPAHPLYWKTVEEYRVGAQRLFGQHMREAVDMYNRYQETKNTEQVDLTMIEMMRRAFFDAHEKVSIGKMMGEYQKLFRHVLDGTGAAGYESRQIPATANDAHIKSVMEFLAETYKLDGQAQRIEDFLKGRGPIVDAINIIAQKGKVDAEEAQRVIFAAWLAAAYGFDGTSIPQMTRIFSGEMDDQELFTILSVSVSEIQQKAKVLKDIVQKEMELRRIDDQYRSGRGMEISPERKHLTRKGLAEDWTALSGEDEAGEAVPAGTENTDKAMVAGEDVGGIDLNAAFLDLKIRRDDKGMILPISQQPLEELMRIDGLMPVIINITPIQSLPMMLGMEENVGAPHAAPVELLSKGK